MMILFIVAIVVCATATTYLLICVQRLPTPPRKHRVFAGVACDLVGFILSMYSLQYLNATKFIIGIVIGLSIGTAIYTTALYIQSRKDSEDE